MEEEDVGPADAAPAATSPEEAETSTAAISRSAASPTGTAPTTDVYPRSATATSRSTSSSAPNTAPSTATSAPAPPILGTPQDPQNPQANGGAVATASSSLAQIRRRPGAAKAAALARSEGAPDVPVARAAATGAPKGTAPMTTKPVPRPAPVRTMGTMRRAATAAEQPDLHDTNMKVEVEFSVEFEKLINSMATISGGLAKIFAGCGLKIIDKAEKERRDAEEKADTEQKREAELKALEEENSLSPEDAVIWKKKKKEEEEKKKKEEEEKEKRVACLLAIPRCVVNTSAVLDGIKEIASGSIDSFFAVGTMIRGIPSLMVWKRGSAMGPRREGHESVTSSASLGTGTVGLRTAINRQILTRGYDGSIQVMDGFGLRKQTICRDLMGTHFITTMPELHQTIVDFECGNLTQLIDIDKKQVNLLTAHEMWLLLCSENLTGILHQNSPLPEKALRAVSILEEERAIKSQLDDIRNATSGLESLAWGLREKLEEKPPKEKSERD